MALSITPLSSTNPLVTQYYTLPIILSADKNVPNNITKNTLLTTSSTFNGLGNNRSTTNTSQNLPVYETHHYLMNKLPYQASSIFDIASLKSADNINGNLNHNHQYSSNLTNNLQNTLDSSLSSAFSTDFTSPTNSSVSFDEVSYNNFTNNNINNSSTYISNNLYQSGFSIYGFPHNKQRKRTHYTQEQLNCLEDLFQKNHYPNSEEKKKLSYKIDIEEAKIHVWFQNRRSRENKSKKFGNKKMKMATNSFEDSESNLSQDIMDMNNESYQNDQCEQNITTHFKSNNLLDSSYKLSNIGYTYNNNNNQYIEIANNNCNNIKAPETSDNTYFLSKYIYDKKTNQIIEQKFDYNNVKNLLIHNQSHINEVQPTPLLSNFLNKSTGSNTMQNGTSNHILHTKSGMLNVQWNNNVMFKSINDSNNLNGNVSNTTYNLNDYYININKNLMVASKAMILTNSSNGSAYIPKNIVSDQNCAMVKGNDNILNLNRSSSILDLVNAQNSTVPASATTLDNLVYSVLNKCKPSIYLEHNYKTTSIENGTPTAMTADSNNKIYNNFNINVDKEPENLNNAINCYNRSDVNTPSYSHQGIDPKQKSTTMDEMISKPIQPISDYVCSGEAYENFGCQQYPAVSDNAHCSNNLPWSFFLDDTVDNGMDLCNEEFAAHNSISTPNYYENKTPSPLFDFPTDIFQSSPLPLSVTTGKNSFIHATHNYFPNESINDDLYTDSCPQVDDNYELKNFLVPSPKYEIPGLKSLNEQTSFFETLSKVEFEEGFKQPTNQLPPLSFYFKHSNNQSFKDNADTASKETFDFFHDETPINMAETLPSNLSYNINNSNLNGLYDGFEMADIFPNYENM